MRSILSVILWLAFASVAFAAQIEDPSQLSIPSNFEVCQNLHPLYGNPNLEMDAELNDIAALFGSLTGFVDYSSTDTMLRFLDEYVGASLQSYELRDTLQYFLRLDFEGIDVQLPSIYNQISLN